MGFIGLRPSSYWCFTCASWGVHLVQLHNDSVMFVTIDQETRQQRLLMVVAALSLVIIFSLLALWRYTRFRTRAEALIAETGFGAPWKTPCPPACACSTCRPHRLREPGVCRMIGWNRSRPDRAHHSFPVLGARPLQAAQETLDLLLSGRTPSSGLEVEAQRRDGSRFTARMYVAPARPQREQIGWMTSMTDITEPKRIREALTAAHERFMTVLEGLDDAISVVADTPSPSCFLPSRTYRRFWCAVQRS